VVTAEQFAEELAELVLRASPHLPARAPDKRPED
jgi:hypothetical protein